MEAVMEKKDSKTSEEKLKEILERGCLDVDELDEVVGGQRPIGRDTDLVTSSGVTRCCW
jgi:hypothetical protein